MRVQLFGIGLKGESPAITAQERVNCFAQLQEEPDRTKIALVRTPGKTQFTDIGANPSRGMWSVDTLPVPVFFTVHGNTLFSVNGIGIATAIGTINTTMGNVSMADNGNDLILVDGTNGWVFDMILGGALVQIIDGNFTTTPKTVTWQDTYAIVTSGGSNQFQLSNNADFTTWPAVNINFTGSAPGAVQAGIADHSVLQLFGNVYAEFWQNAGAPDFPYALIPGSAQEFGLASGFSLFKYDNSLAGLFKNRMGEVNMSRMSGFRLERLSNFELEKIINSQSVYQTVADCTGFGYMLGGHPMGQFNFPTANRSWLFDGAMRQWSQLKDNDGDRDWGEKFCNFNNQRLVSDYRSGKIYKVDPEAYDNNGETLPMEVTSKHIWNDDKFIGISQVQVDVQSGVGLDSGQGSDPQMMLSVSKDGGRTFRELAWSSMGKVGQYTKRVIWRSLGGAQDWVLRLRVTDPVKTIITGASAEIQGGPF